MTTTGRSTRVRPVRVAKAVAVVDRRPDGTTYLRNPNPLGPYPVALTDRLVDGPKKRPAARWLPSGTHTASGST